MMKVAIVISGNLRTFLMPVKGNRICDLLMKNIVEQNMADVFAYTDTNDFLYNDINYFPENRRIEIIHGDSWRIHDKVEFIDHETAKDIIEEQIKSVIGERLKSLIIEPPYDVTKDDKFNLFNAIGTGASNTSMLIHQWRKLNLAYKSLLAYKKDNNIEYDIIIKWRFDIYTNTLLILNNYCFKEADVYVPAIEVPTIYDWFAFGTKRGIEFYMNMYDYLGTLSDEGRIYSYWCHKCPATIYYGPKICERCPRHPQDNLAVHDITMASEYYLYRLFEKNGVRAKVSKYPARPYRYGSPGRPYMPVEDAIKKLGIKNVTVVCHQPGNNADIINNA